MKRKRPRYVLKVNISPPPNAPIAHVPSPSPTPAHTSSPTPGLTPISTAASFPCPRTADIPSQSRRDISPPHLPQPQLWHQRLLHQIYPDRGDAESNNEDDTLSFGHALPMISPYGNG
ncbi:hypothetical protein VNO80_01031 [Phaseolus coccineus]|uniref:Uncharacterized protein n=1 Tax=Phaseolus coccineus TaxID=3886 RepID=A0AAN9P4G9_PHACN